jgi:hypothetical protein
LYSCGQSVILFSKESNQEKGSKDGCCAEVYITKDYSVELSEDDIKSIARDVRITLYNKQRPYDYTVADILIEAGVLTGMYIEYEMERGTEEEYCMGDLDNKQRTKEDYWHVIKLVLEQVDVIAK